MLHRVQTQNKGQYGEKATKKPSKNNLDTWQIKSGKKIKRTC